MIAMLTLSALDYRYTSDPLASERNSTSGYSSISSSRASSSYTPSLYRYTNENMNDFCTTLHHTFSTVTTAHHGTAATTPTTSAGTPSPRLLHMTSTYTFKHVLTRLIMSVFRYGKELSNYDRWRLSNGELLDGYTDKSNNNNSRFKLDPDLSNHVRSCTFLNCSVDSVVKTRRRISRMEDSNPEPLTNGLSRDFDFDSILNSSSTTSSAAIKADPNPIAAPVLPGTGREMSIMPGESVNAVPSRYGLPITDIDGRTFLKSYRP